MSLQDTYDEYQQTIRALEEHITSIETQFYEHEIVIDTLKKVDGERPAWRLVSAGDTGVGEASSGALVETTASEALSKLETTVKGLNELKTKVGKEVQDVRKEFVEWKTKNNIKVVSANQ
ncbi:Prefoldin subunit 2 [Pichia kudriavzevii]|uniref:Prefoldin subunit 2 n=1 Tax=Pichia kudriavzevii TaxID=4909 RepID=A0A1V2LIJ8_PICKU|nr:Prefoldin subunit 2 [Pichia kudriavzevii]